MRLFVFVIQTRFGWQIPDPHPDNEGKSHDKSIGRCFDGVIIACSGKVNCFSVNIMEENEWKQRG